MTPQPQGLREAIEAIWDKVREAADGFHNSQQWGEEGHWGPDVSYWKQIRAAVDAAKALALLPGDTTQEDAWTWRELAETLAVHIKLANESETFEEAKQWCRDGMKEYREERSKKVGPGDTKDPALLTWTREKPKVGGWYFYKTLPLNPGEPLWIGMYQDSLHYWHVVDECFYTMPDGEWAGPIPEPTPLTESKVTE